MRRTVVILFVISIALSVITCSKSSSNQSQRNTDQSQKIVRFGRNTAVLPTLDVFLSPWNSIFQFSDLVLDRLFEKNDNTLELELGLLEDWPRISDDGTIYTFKLKEGVKFHDGTELTASDVEYTLNRFYHPDTASINTWVCEVIKGCNEMLAGEADTLEGFKLIDKYRFSIELYYPYSAFESVLATSMMPILPAKAREEAGDRWGTDVFIGTGPFKLESFVPNVGFTFTVNRDYFGKLPQIDGIQVLNIEEESTRLMEWEVGNIDMVVLGEVEIVEEYLRKYPKNVQSQDYVGAIWLKMNLDIPPLNNPKVREAISLATDTEDIVNGLFNGMKALSHTVLPSGIPGFNPNAKPHVYDPARAKVLLAEAGFPNGVEIIATTAGDWVTILEVVKSQYEKVGITLDIQRMDDATFSDVIDNGKAQFIIWEWYADFMDGDMYMYTIFYSKQATAFSTGFRDSWFDAQVEKARRTSGAEKAAIYSELDDYIVNNVHMVIPIFQDRGFVLMSDRVKNVFMKKDLLLTFRNAVIE